MKHTQSNNGAFPLVYVHLDSGEEVRIERNAMVYHNGHVALEGKMNSNSTGIGGAIKALGRSIVSNESFFVTIARGNKQGSLLALAPASMGQIMELTVGQVQWRLNDGAFLAGDTSVTYTMKRQSLGRAIFSGTGGLFVMETTGTGSVLVNGFGDIIELELDGTNEFVIDNFHVLAWESTLQYKLEIASGTFGFTTGEGIVNRFSGKGKVLIQSRNRQALYQLVEPFIPKGS